MSHLRFIGAAITVVLASFAVVASPAKTATAQAADTETTTTQAPVSPAKNPYEYKARSGDNYSVLARKAVQTMGLIDHISLSQAQIIAAETMLTSEADFPQLNEGQTVTFATENVKKAMDAAQKLSPDQQAAWAYYVPFVDFDTRQNGE